MDGKSDKPEDSPYRVMEIKEMQGSPFGEGSKSEYQVAEQGSRVRMVLPGTGWSWVLVLVSGIYLGTTCSKTLDCCKTLQDLCDSVPSPVQWA